MSSDAMVDVLQRELGESLLQHHSSDDGVAVRVHRDAWRRAAEVAKSALECEYFCFLSGMDWLPNPDLDGEKTFVVDRAPASPADVITDEAIRRTGGSSRFQVMARVYNTTTHEGLFLSADLDDGSPSAPSWTPVYAGADWHEREIAEMFGFDFEGHPGLRHIYLPEEFEGFPLRKDFPLLARMVRPWPGLVDMEEMPPKPDEPEPEQDFA